jgi:hypothetical protein
MMADAPADPDFDAWMEGQEAWAEAALFDSTADLGGRVLSVGKKSFARLTA